MSLERCHEDDCDGLVEWRVDALDEDGCVGRSLFACSDGEAVAQAVFRCIFSSGQPTVSANVMQWVSS